MSISSEAVGSDKSFNELIGIAKEIVKNMFGEAGEKLLDYLVSKGYIAEERIATSIDVRSNEARKILQRLSDEALVVPDRLRDEETGEVLHIWRLNNTALKSFILNRLRKTREKLELLLKYESEGSIYICRTCNRRFYIDEAYAYGFQCPHDNDVLVEANNPTTIANLKESIRKINTLISMIERMQSGGGKV